MEKEVEKRVDWWNIFYAFYLDFTLSVFIIPYIVNIILLFSKNQTLGQKFLGLRLVKKNGGRLSKKQIFTRIFSHIPLLFPTIILLVVIFNFATSAFAMLGQEVILSSDIIFDNINWSRVWIIIAIVSCFYILFSTIGSLFTPSLSQRIIGVKTIQYREVKKWRKYLITFWIFITTYPIVYLSDRMKDNAALVNMLEKYNEEQITLQEFSTTINSLKTLTSEEKKAMSQILDNESSYERNINLLSDSLEEIDISNSESIIQYLSIITSMKKLNDEYIANRLGLASSINLFKYKAYKEAYEKDKNYIEIFNSSIDDIQNFYEYILSVHDRLDFDETGEVVGGDLSEEEFKKINDLYSKMTDTSKKLEISESEYFEFKNKQKQEISDKYFSN